MLTRVSNLERLKSAAIIAAVLMLIACASALRVPAQSRALSLADILIALRSKKADPGEKNKILADAVKQRGITFALTSEIEKELDSTGAATDLIAAIREKAPPPPVKAAAKEPQAPVPAPEPEPAAAPPPPPPAARTYTVVSGDTLWAISERFYGDGSKYQLIADASGVSNPDLIYPGQVLTIP